MEAARSDEDWLALAQAKGITPDMLYGVDLQNEDQKKWLYEQFGHAERFGEQIKLLGFLRQYKVKRDQGRDLFGAEQQKQKWYHVTGSISRHKTHAGARRELFKFASSGGLYPQGLDADTVFETKALPNVTDRTILRFSVIFKSDDRALEFVDNIGQYLLVNRGDLELFDYSGNDSLERPMVSEIASYPITFESQISVLDYKHRNGDEATPGSPVVDVVMETRSADCTVVTLLSIRNEVFQFQRIENSLSFALAEPEAAHIFPSSKCSGTYEWLDDKPYNRLALSRDFHVTFDGTGRGRGNRKTAQVFALRPKRPDDGFHTCEIEGVVCYEIPLELIVNQNDKAEGLLAKLGKNCQLNKRTNGRWTIDGADVRIYYPKNRRVQLVSELPDNDGEPIDLVTSVPGVTNLSECWSQSDQNLLSLEAAEVLEK